MVSEMAWEFFFFVFFLNPDLLSTKINSMLCFTVHGALMVLSLLYVQLSLSYPSLWGVVGECKVGWGRGLTTAA